VKSILKTPLFTSYKSKTMAQLIGRQPEIKILTQAFDSEESEMVAVIGRRRVGKTFLVRNVLNDKIDLEFTGIQNTTSKPQIENFHFLLSNFAKNTTSLPVPKNWLEAFRQLITVLENESKPNRKRVLFFDELP
jgi:uncharacterized protein